MQDERAPSRLPGHGSAEVPLGDPAMAPLGSEIQAAAQEHFAALADAVPLIVWTARPDGRVDYANRRWFEYAGMSFDQTRGWGAVLHPDDLHRCIDRWNEAVTTGEAYEIEYRFRRADGVYRWHLGRALPLRDRDGRIVRWFGTCTDIDDQKRAEQAQRLLAEAGDLLASSLDHEATLSNIVRL
ncbi:MAG: PAS domain-containing protein, partial [Chloroflexota bacterium]